MAYELSVKAEEDIINIYREGTLLFGTEQAERYHVEMERIFEFLADTPKAARERTEITPPVRIHPYGSHMIVYLIDELGAVLILRVRHGREDWAKMPL